MSANADMECVAPVPAGVGDAVGVDSRKWYVAVVNNNSEKKVQECLEKMHYEAYVARQQVLKIWKNNRKVKVDKVVIPSKVFIRCTELERKEIVALSFIKRFLTDKARTSVNGLTKPLAVIPQSQIDTMRFMLGQSDIPITFVETPLRRHDRVMVVRGHLKGIEGEVVQTCDGKSEVIVRIELLGSAKMTIDTVNLQLVK